MEHPKKPLLPHVTLTCSGILPTKRPQKEKTALLGADKPGNDELFGMFFLFYTTATDIADKDIKGD